MVQGTQISQPADASRCHGPCNACRPRAGRVDARRELARPAFDSPKSSRCRVRSPQLPLRPPVKTSPEEPQAAPVVAKPVALAPPDRSPFPPLPPVKWFRLGFGHTGAGACRANDDTEITSFHLIKNRRLRIISHVQCDYQRARTS